jgi:hypothetical protein
MFAEALAGYGGGNGSHDGFDIGWRVGLGIEGFVLAWATMTENKDHAVAGLGGITFGAQVLDG